MNNKCKKKLISELKIAIIDLFKKVQTEKPLIHHITNYVTTNDCANIVLALGGSPVMADEVLEVEDIVQVAKALVINMGTINSRTFDSMKVAVLCANKHSVPVVLDPVGVGASKYRKEIAEELLKIGKFAVIRGNYAEVLNLSGLYGNSKGVDSAVVDGEMTPDILAKYAADKFSSIVAITGKIDYISDGTHTIAIKNGHENLTNITGTGCMSTSLVATFCGVAKTDLFLATISGILTMGIAGELATAKLKKKEGLGTFKVNLFDEINTIEKAIYKMGRVNYV